MKKISLLFIMLLSTLSSCLKDNDIQPSDTNLFVATEVNRTVTQIALVDEMTIDDEVFNASLELDFYRNEALELKNKEIQKLKAQRDTTDEYASNMQQRSNKAIHDRDESNYALKQALVEVEKYKSHLKIAESLIGSERHRENNKKSLITPISVGMTTILAIVLFGRRFS